MLYCNINSKSYIGITTNLNKRWIKHKYDMKHNSSCVIHRAMRKHGIEHFSMIELCKCTSKELLLIQEKLLINILQTHTSLGGYNQTFGGEAPMLGRKHSEKSKLQTSMKMKGRVSPNKGNKSTNITKQKISKINSKSVIQMTLDGEIIMEYKSITEAGKICGIAGTNISGVCLGRKKSAGDFCWQYSGVKNA